MSWGRCVAWAVAAAALTMGVTGCYGIRMPRACVQAEDCERHPVNR
jgi:hypothetical protein